MEDLQVAREALAVVTEAADAMRAAEVRQTVALVRLAESYRVGSDDLVEVLTEKLVFPGDDGTPGVSEFLALELGAALGIPQRAALELVAGALNLKHRMPQLWKSFFLGLIPLWQATKLTDLTGTLSRAQALEVDAALVAKVGRVAYPRLRQLVRGLVVQADPAAAKLREHKSRQARGVFLTPMRDGSIDLFASLDPREAKALDKTLSELACAMGEAGDDRTLQQRRSTALGLLADPAAALTWLEDPTTTTANPERRARRGRGRAVVYVHLAAGTVVDPETGVARIEGYGPLTAASLPHFLAGSNVTVRPVIDDAHVSPVDAYEIPDRIREHVHRRNPAEVFPFSSRNSRGLDLDHIRPYQNGTNWQPGQTGPTNLAPVSRLVHRAKTAGVWRVRATPQGHEWWSPLGLGYTVATNGATGPPQPPSADPPDPPDIKAA